jgi:hypothetical protein
MIQAALPNLQRYFRGWFAQHLQQQAFGGFRDVAHKLRFGNAQTHASLIGRGRKMRVRRQQHHFAGLETMLCQFRDNHVL